MTTHEASVHIAAALGAAVIRASLSGETARDAQHAKEVNKLFHKNLESCAATAYAMARALEAFAVADDQLKVATRG